MSFVHQESATLTTNSSGESTGFVGPLNGLVHAIEYHWTDFSTGGSVVVKGEESSRPILTVNLTSTTQAIWFPRSVTHKIADGSTFGTEAQVPISGERVKFVVSSGGNAKTGSFRVLMA